jgi:hypothetical protein
MACALPRNTTASLTLSGPESEHDDVHHLDIDEAVQTASHSWKDVESLFH